MIKNILLIFFYFYTIDSYLLKLYMHDNKNFNMLPLYRYWNCVGFQKDIKNNKPYKFNVGEIPLVAWKDNNNNYISTLNACKHMGSRLDDGLICNGNLYCPYHGLKHTYEDKCGDIKIYDGKIWWAYKPIQNKIPTIPFMNSKKYSTSYLKIDMEEDIPFCIYNSLDLNHPEFVHNGLGFGSSIAPENYKYYIDNINKTAISFDYITKNSIKAINYHMKIENKTINYNEVIYPITSWSKVTSINDINKNIIIGVSMQPLEENLTRWYITLRHNYMTDFIGKKIMVEATKYILNQDKKQFSKQIKNKNLKKFISWRKALKYENHMKTLKEHFNNYQYPKINDFINDLYIDKW